jgi:hypothetical protein
MGRHSFGRPTSLDLACATAIIDEVIHVVVAHLKFVILCSPPDVLLNLILQTTSCTKIISVLCLSSLRLHIQQKLIPAPILLFSSKLQSHCDALI